MSTLQETDSRLATDTGARANAEALNERLAGFALAAFALAAPWSIAAAQTAVGLGILSLVIRLVLSLPGSVAGGGGTYVASRSTTGPPAGAHDASRPEASAGIGAGAGAGARAGAVGVGAGASRSRFWSGRRPESRWPTRWPWTFRVLLLFLAVQVVSIVASIDPSRSLHAFRGSWTYGFPIVFFLLLRGRRDRAIFAARVLVASAALAGIYAIFQATTGMSPLDGEILEDHGGIFMASGTLGHHLTFAGVMLPSFFIALGLAAGNDPAETERLPRILRWVAVLAIAAGLLLCFSRSGWIGLAAGLLLFAFRFGRRALVASGAVLASVASLAYLLLPAIRGRIATVGPASGPRFHLWESAWGIAQAHPWFGGGLGSWKALFPLHRVPGEYISIAHPHNDLLNVLVETGFPGALVWGAIWVVFFVELRPRRPLTTGIAAAVAALLVAGTLQCFITDEEVAQAWMFAIALGLTLRDTERESAREQGCRTGGLAERVSR